MSTNNTPPEKPDQSVLAKILWPLAIGFVVLSWLFTQQSVPPGPTATVSYSEIKTLIRNGDVREATLEENAIVAVLRDRRSDGALRLRAVTPVQPDPALLPLLEDMGVTVTAEAPRDALGLVWFLPWVLILAFYFWLSRRMMGGIGGGMGGGGMGGGVPGGMKDFLRGRSAKPIKLANKVTFADVAGQDEAKREVSELVEFLRDPDRFQRVGATVPHGVLLMGPPGTGKTL
ncbi:MAG: ATP-dependent metallopeptidase FtsH/Yme1/Tma family protein, partial [Rhodobacterales bacterium]